MPTPRAPGEERDDPDRAVWNELADQRREHERRRRECGVAPATVRRMHVDDTRHGYVRALLCLAVDTAAGTVLFYLPGAERSTHFRCPLRGRHDNTPMISPRNPGDHGRVVVVHDHRATSRP
jgi:hypothetical protein